jgi:hypothetical protein
MSLGASKTPSTSTPRNQQMQISGGVIAALVRDNYPRSLLPHYDEKINGGLILGWRTINVCAKRGRQHYMFATICSFCFRFFLLHRMPDCPNLCRRVVSREINLAFIGL